MNEKEYLKTAFFKKFNECVVASRNYQTAKSVDMDECLKMGQLISKDTASISRPLNEAVNASIVRMSIKSDLSDIGDVLGNFTQNSRVRDAMNAESYAWKAIEEPNKVFLASIGYIRVSKEDKPPQQVDTMASIVAMILAALFILPKKKKGGTDQGPASNGHKK